MRADHPLPLSPFLVTPDCVELESKDHSFENRKNYRDPICSMAKWRLEGCQSYVCLRTLMALTKTTLQHSRRKQFKRSDFLSVEGYLLIHFLQFEFVWTAMNFFRKQRGLTANAYCLPMQPYSFQEFLP